MSGLQNKIELARKSGYTDAEIVGYLASSGDMAGKVREAQQAGYGDAEIVGYLSQAPKRSTMQEVGRQVGLTARYGIEGLAAIPNMLGDAAGLQSTKTVSDWLTKFGLPQPEGAQERVVGDVTRAMAGQGGVMKAGRAMTNAAGPVTRTIGNLLASRPGAQVVGAAGSAGASGTTREAGGGPVAQTVAGVVGGLGTPVAADTALRGAQATARGVVAGSRPFTQSGREVVVGDTLKRMATDPNTVAQRLENVAEIVPGSAPTTAQAARDPGLLTAERALRSGPSGGRFAEQQSKANQARNLLLNTMAGDEKSLEALKRARESKAGPLYRAAREEGIDAGMADALKPQIQNLMSRMPKGVLEKARELARLNGETFDKAGSVNGLHWMKMAIDDQISSAKQTGVGAQTTRGLTQFKDDLLSVIDEVSPKYGRAREAYAKLSQPVNQAEALQDVRSRVLNPGTDAQTGERIMSAAKFYQAVTKNDAELAKVLTGGQMKSLRSIAQDLDRGALSDSAGRAAGSNTYQNVSTAYVLGQALGGKSAESPVLQNLLRPLAWLNKLNEPQLQQLLTDAMLDPALARSLMMRANPRAIESVALELTQRAKAFGVGAAQGTAATSGDRRNER